MLFLNPGVNEIGGREGNHYLVKSRACKPYIVPAKRKDDGENLCSCPADAVYRKPGQ
jgi:hypothetical protein